MNNVPEVAIASREFKADPYPFYARLRAAAPVYRTLLPDKRPVWLITRYDDVLVVLKDEQRFTKDWTVAMTPAQQKKMPWLPPMFRPLLRTILDTDGPEHHRLRGLIHKAFTPALIEQMRARIERLSGDLLDAAAPRGRMDIIRDYALPIPLTIISEMLGVPPRDRANFSRWTKAMINASAGRSSLLAFPQVWMMIRYINRLIRERHASPQDDLISALVQAEESGERLNADELLAMIFVLIVAGHETTVNLIGSGSLALIENPTQMRLLHLQPELIKNAIEELVRYVSPVEQATERYASEDVTMHGVTIPRGEMVFAVIASANRDEKHFTDGDRLDLTRENSKHLSFGLGAHYCVGAPLARLEGQIAIQMLVQRYQALHLQTQPAALRWRPGVTVRGLEALPVAF